MKLSMIEAALDAGKLEGRMSNGRWWRLRRNGATKRWKTRPDDFRIPVKAGLKSHGYIDNDTRFGDEHAVRVVE